MKALFREAVMIIGLLVAPLSLYSSDSKFLKIYIKNVSNKGTEASNFGQLEIGPKRKFRFKQPIKVPFISIKNYLRAFAMMKPYTPSNALKIGTSHGLYRLWANEAGVMVARDPQDCQFSLDEWKSNTIFEFPKKEESTNAVLLAHLVMITTKEKFTAALEPAGS